MVLNLLRGLSHEKKPLLSTKRGFFQSKPTVGVNGATDRIVHRDGGAIPLAISATI